MNEYIPIQKTRRNVYSTIYNILVKYKDKYKGKTLENSKKDECKGKTLKNSIDIDNECKGKTLKNSIDNECKGKDNINVELQKIALNIERGIFNMTLEEAKNKVWDDYFKSLYINKAVNIYTNLNPESYLKNKSYIYKVLDREWNEFQLPRLTAQERFSELYPYCEKCEIIHYNKLKCEGKVVKVSIDDIPDGQFKCFICTKNKRPNYKTSYYELQLRSADEPATVFVTCLVCDKRWRIG